MPYDVDADPYLDPISGILRNLLGVSSESELENVEANITAAILGTLLEKSLPGNFDLTRLKAIHKELFSAIYPWAGELRTVEIAKGSTRFANSEFLEQAASELFSKLLQENLLNNLQEQQYAERFAHYYSEVNILHPFREGNGRTQRAFFSLLAARSEKRIAWEHMDPKENLRASIAAYNGDEQPLVIMISSLLKPL